MTTSLKVKEFYTTEASPMGHIPIKWYRLIYSVSNALYVSLFSPIGQTVLGPLKLKMVWNHRMVLKPAPQKPLFLGFDGTGRKLGSNIRI